MNLSELLTLVSDRQQVQPTATYRLCGVKWYGQGVFERESVLGSEQSASVLHVLRSGRLIYNRLFAWKASFAIVDECFDGLFVSNEFPQFEIDRKQIDPRYILAWLTSSQTIDLIQRNSEGSTAVSRNRFKESSIPALEILLPSLQDQKRICDDVASQIAQAETLEVRAASVERSAHESFVQALGLSVLRCGKSDKAFALRWSAIDRWGANANRAAAIGRRSGRGGYAFALGVDCLLDVMHGCSASPSPVFTGLEVLKISAVTRGVLDISEKKNAPNDPKIRDRFSLRRGDVLLCRTNGTLAYVGAAALVHDDHPDLIFPDKVIRVRVASNLLPEFFWRVLSTEGLRAQIESFARTAVGNHAIGGADLWRLRIPLPPLDVQERLVYDMDAALASASGLRVKAKRLRDGARANLETALLGQLMPSP